MSTNQAVLVRALNGFVVGVLATLLFACSAHQAGEQSAPGLKVEPTENKPADETGVEPAPWIYTVVVVDQLHPVNTSAHRLADFLTRTVGLGYEYVGCVHLNEKYGHGFLIFRRRGVGE